MTAANSSCRQLLAIVAAKLSASTIRRLNLGLGSNLPGRLARRLEPNVLRNLARQARKGVVVVSGTNGKSTSAGFVASILAKAEIPYVHNRQGANLITGITASIVEASAWSGKLDCDYCLFEVDEAALPLFAKEVTIQAALVTNLFRDQLDRFGELDTTAKLISKGIEAQETIAVLNADDPNVAQLKQGGNVRYFGLESVLSKPQISQEKNAGGPEELSACPGCGAEFDYELKFYGQLGHYVCLKCGLRRPKLDVFARNVKLESAGATFELLLGGKSYPAQLRIPGLFNVYNAVGAAALCYELCIKPELIVAGLADYATLFGRSERISLNGTDLLIQLIKNPAGASQVVASAAAEESALLMIAINDNYADGRDISWLWDTDFELLARHKGPFVVAGNRALDMAVRLKYAGVNTQDIVCEPDLNQALDAALNLSENKRLVWVLPTYTCLLSMQKNLKERGIHLAGT